MAEQSQNTMASIGSALSWRDLEEEERRAEGRPTPAEEYESEIVGDLPGAVPSIVPDIFDEAELTAERRANWRSDGWPQRDDGVATRGLVVAVLLAFCAVAALLGVAFAV
jgi:hypothetical protein